MKQKITNTSVNLSMLIAWGLASYAMFIQSASIGLLYIGILLTSFFLIVKSYCSRCPVKQSGCSHVVPGYLTRFMKDKRPGQYSITELLITAFCLLLISLTPQLALWKDKPLFILFWALNLYALSGIRFFICKRCGNKFCLMNGKLR